jgi:hypothetical protein
VDPSPTPKPPPDRPRRRWRLLRGLFLGVGGIGLILAMLVGAAALYVQTAEGQRRVADLIVSLVAPKHGTLTIGDLETDLFTHVNVTDATLARADGQRVVHVDRIALTYDLGGIIGGVLRAPKVAIDGVEVTLSETADGLDIAGMWDDGQPSTGPWRGVGIDLVFSDVALTHTTFTYARANDERYTVANATLHAAVELRGAAVLVHDLWVEAPQARVSKPGAVSDAGLAPELASAGASDPAEPPAALARDLPPTTGGGTDPVPPVVSDLGAVSLSAGARWDPSTLWIDHVWASVGPHHAALQGGFGALGGDPTVGFGVSELHVDVPALEPLTGPLPVIGAFDARGTIAGLLAAPRFLLEVTTPGGNAHAEGSIDTRLTPAGWTASAALDDVDLHTFLPSLPDPTVLRGLATLEGAGVKWPDGITATASFNLVSPRLEALRDLTADGAVRLEGGVLTVERVAARGPGVGLRTGATIDLVHQTGTSSGTTAGLDLRLLRMVGVRDLLGHIDFSGETTFGWGDQLGVTLRGDAGGSGAGYAGIGAARHLGGPVDVTWSPAAGARADVDLVLAGVEGQGFVAETGAAQLVVTVDPNGNVGIDGGATLGALTGPDVRGERIELTARLDRSARGKLDGFVDATTTQLSWRDYASDMGTAKVRFSGDVAAIDVSLLDEARTVVAIDAEIDMVAQSLRARTLEVAPTEALAWRSDGVQTVRLVEGGVADLRVRLVSGDALITAEGYGRKKDLIDLRLEVRGVELATLDELLGGRFTGYRGDITLRASMEGHASRPTLFVDVDAVGLTIPEVIAGVDVELQGQGGDRRMHAEGTLRATDTKGRGQRLAWLRADIPFSLAVDAPGLVTEGDVDIQVVLPPVDSGQWNAVLATDLPDLRASAEVTLVGPILDPRLGVVASVDLPTGERREWVRFDLDADTVDGTLQLRAVGRERFERRAEVQGGIELFLGNVARSLAGVDTPRDLADINTWMSAIELDLVPLRLPVQTLAPFVAGFPQRLTGDLVGGLHVSGSVHDPKVEGALLLASGRLGDLALSPAMLTVAPKPGTTDGDGYAVDLNLGFGSGAAALISGFVPFDPAIDGDFAAELKRPGLSLELKSDKVPLTAVAAAWPQMEAYAGVLAANGTIRGTLADPSPSVDFSLKDGDFVLFPTGVHYEAAGFTGHLGREEVRVSDLSVRTSRRRLVELKALDPSSGRITGNVIARRIGDRPAIEGQLRLDRAWVLDVQSRVLRTSGALDLADRDERLLVTGELAVTEGSLTVAERFFSGQADLSLDADTEVIRGGVARRSEKRHAEGLALPTWLDVEVQVDLARNTFLDATLPLEQMVAKELSGLSTVSVSTQLDGELTASIHGGQLSLVGIVSPLRGTARVMGLPFDLPEGSTIAFTGLDYANPELDLKAERTTQEYGTIVAEITGTPSALQLAFTSADLDQDDVLAVLILGRPLSEAGDSSALLGVVASALSQQVVGSRSRAFDVLELDSEGDIRVGRRLQDNVFLVGETNIGALFNPDGSNAVEITLEVQLDRHWQFDFTTGTAGVTTAGLNRKWRF